MKFNCNYSTELIEIFIIDINEILGVNTILVQLNALRFEQKKSKK